MAPVNWLSFSASHVSLAHFATPAGSGPDRRLPPTLRLVRPGMEHSSGGSAPVSASAARREIEHSAAAGSAPENWLSSSESVRSAAHAPTPAGTGPKKKLESSVSSASRGQRHSCAGNAPLKKPYDRSSARRLLRFPSSSGSGPCRPSEVMFSAPRVAPTVWVELRSSVCSAVRLPSSRGSAPESGLLASDSAVRLASWPREAGMAPTRFWLLRSRRVRLRRPPSHAGTGPPRLLDERSSTRSPVRPASAAGMTPVTPANPLLGSYAAEPPELHGDLAVQVVVAQRQHHQVGQLAQLRRDGPLQVVGAQVQELQPRQLAQLGRDAVRQRVGAEVQVLQLRQVAELGRQRRPLSGRLRRRSRESAPISGATAPARPPSSPGPRMSSAVTRLCASHVTPAHAHALSPPAAVAGGSTQSAMASSRSPPLSSPSMVSLNASRASASAAFPYVHAPTHARAQTEDEEEDSEDGYDDDADSAKRAWWSQTGGRERSASGTPRPLPYSGNSMPAPCSSIKKKRWSKQGAAHFHTEGGGATHRLPAQQQQRQQQQQAATSLVSHLHTPKLLLSAGARGRSYELCARVNRGNAM
eukprot:jgi/Mesen1/7338/ME000377S06556